MTIKWKAESICQTLPIWQRNVIIPSETISNDSIFRAQPTKHFRREIESLSSSVGSRTGIRIASYETPASISTNTQNCADNCNASFLDLQRTSDNSERPCKIHAEFGRSGFVATNALRRVRSSANIRRNISTQQNVTTGAYSISEAPELEYKNNYSQYLTSRAKTFKQNQFQYVKNGESTKTVIYKRNNPNFATQGAVSSGDRLLRLKYHTVTNTACLIGESYGTHFTAANNYIYSLNSNKQNPLMMKTKKAVVKKTPVLEKYTNTMCYKTNTRI